MTEPWARILAAFLGVIGTLLVSRFDDIVNLFRRSVQSIEGEWNVVSYRVHFEDDAPEKRSRVGKYHVNLKQIGRKVSGTMTATEVKEGMKQATYSWRGQIRGNWLTYDLIGTDPSQLLLGTGMVYIHTVGHLMSGYFVANSGPDKSELTWVGFTEMEKRN